MKIATLNMCQHQHRKHLCDNGTTSAMEYWWCPDCGSLGSRGGGDVAVLKWDLPNQLTCDHAYDMSICHWGQWLNVCSKCGGSKFTEALMA